MFKATEKNLNLFIMPSAYTLEMNEKSDACAIKWLQAALFLDLAGSL